MLAGALIRWLDEVALALVLGSLAFDLVVLDATPARPGDVRGRVARLRARALATLVAASCAELVWRAQAMAGDGLGAAFAALPAVLTKTHFGMIFVARAAGLVALVLLRGASSRGALGLALAVACGVAATSALWGHAADWGDLRPIACNDWLHVVASAAWTGGLACLWVASPRAAGEGDARFLAQVARRFSRLAAACLLVVVASGVANVLTQVQDLSALWRTSYGGVLVAKLVLVAGLVALGALNRYRVVPQLARDVVATADAGRGDPSAARRFARYVAAEVALAALVLACTALLGQLAPPRHDPASHGGAHGNASSRASDGGRTAVAPSGHGTGSSTTVAQWLPNSSPSTSARSSRSPSTRPRPS